MGRPKNPDTINRNGCITRGITTNVFEVRYVIEGANSVTTETVEIYGNEQVAEREVRSRYKVGGCTIVGIKKLSSECNLYRMKIEDYVKGAEIIQHNYVPNTNGGEE